MYHLINQEDFLRAIVGDPEYYTVCHGLIMCGSPLQNDGGSAMLKDYNPKKALQLLKEAGYKGEPITVLAATDHVTITPATQVLIQAMREAGLNVDAQSMDWGSVVSRRAKKEPPAQGGWNIFVTTSGGGRRRQSDPAYLDRRGLRQGAVRLAVRSRDREAAQRLRFRADRRREEESRARPAGARRWSRSSTFRSANGRRRYAYRADRIDGNRSQHRLGGAVEHQQEVAAVPGAPGGEGRRRGLAPAPGRVRAA